MDSYNLKTASTYINNLLLARGLLRNGTPIEFAHPSRGEGGKEATMAQIINLVHDLILKRDRDQEYRESIADTLRSLRAESTRQTAALEKQHNRNADLSRQLSLAQAQEQSARKALHAAESSARKLRAEMQRLKTTVDQVRTSCTNDVRKRDKEIARLKSHLTSQQRGNKTGLVGASITINPGSTGLGAATGHVRDESPNVDDPEYSLKQETTEFLTQLSQSLSDENDNLIGLVRSALLTLRELQGMPEVNRKQDADNASVTGDEQDDTQQDMLHTLPTDYETLADDMDTVLDNLKNLLTNPNFVAVDEVEMREEEIHRLRAGWEKMEARLRESFLLMDSWRKRMTNGDTINLEELRMGLGFSQGFETVDREGFSVIDEESEAEEATSSALEEDVDDTEEQEEAVYLPSPKIHTKPDKTTGPDVFSIKLQPSQPALRETNGNKSLSRSPRKVAFSASIPNTPSQVDGENADASGIDSVDVEKTSRPTSAAKPLRSEERASRPTSQDRQRHVRYNIFPSASTPSSISSPSAPHPSLNKSDSLQQTKKRLSSPRAHPDERSPKLSVQDKLREAAEAAAVTDGDISTKKTDESTEVSEENPKKRAPRSPVKTRISGRPKRRKSTLTPEELANLLGC
ncbi:Afadin and alpha-actinin-binding-domain-containing protein [Alternaria rosae]|uniref:Afadin and alpha-actinin-binding-domain-containing protein n=1 Tax=Alternaria rosae TaxID=1187941 RepID=UPI001E8CCD2F|nr:Afadin and alpha-actinin-binding-domain-containing protein [Alternaria rosae]KAH6878667.1 Afadin and alpha-actinin-binding-domain-containing protein [Alternaria rosae]